MNEKHIVGSNGLVVNKKGQLLLVKRSKNDKYFADKWELPGGGVNDNETPQESLKREILEECGLEVTVSFPLGAHTFLLKENNENVHVIEVTFLCSLKKDQIVALSHEHSAYKWIAKEEVKDFDLSDYMREVIEDALKNPLAQI